MLTAWKLRARKLLPAARGTKALQLRETLNVHQAFPLLSAYVLTSLCVTDMFASHQ